MIKGSSFNISFSIQTPIKRSVKSGSQKFKDTLCANGPLGILKDAHGMKYGC